MLGSGHGRGPQFGRVDHRRSGGGAGRARLVPWWADDRRGGRATRTQVVMREAPTSDAGEPPSAFCPRCKRRSDPDAINGRVGLCHCFSCGEYACRWCWGDAAGACPTCAYPYVVAAAAALTPRSLLAAFLRRFELRRSIAAGRARYRRRDPGADAGRWVPADRRRRGRGRVPHRTARRRTRRSSPLGSPSDSPGESTEATAGRRRTRRRRTRPTRVDSHSRRPDPMDRRPPPARRSNR